MIQSNFLLQIAVTADQAVRIVSSIAAVVTNLNQEDEQNVDNLGLIAGVLGQIDNLIADEQFNATKAVSIASHVGLYCSSDRSRILIL